jgi:adenosylcobinamide-GDP ribazoletransferase
MKGLIAAVEFLTILPLGKPATFDPKRMIPFFPIVGMILGTLLSIFDRALSSMWPEPVVAVLDVVFLVLLTGALHVDGLGDTADGLFSHRSREKTLAIMRDSRIGVMGLVAIICGLSIKWGGISHLHNDRSLLLVIIPAYARGGMLFGMRFLEYGRSENGMGHPFFSHTLMPLSFSGLIIPVLLSFFLGWKGIWLNTTYLMITVAILWYYKRRINCITGDMLGAMTEVTEAMLFLLAEM